MTYKIDDRFKLGDGQGSNNRATGKMIVAHSTGNQDAGGYNEASYMHNNYNNAYVHAICDIGIVYMVGEVGYQAWGAMQTANTLSPLQVELCEYSDNKKQLLAYNTYCEFIRDYAKKLGIPLTVDDDTRIGVKTHNWVSKHFEGDHIDPTNVLKRLGKSLANFQSDLRGVTSEKGSYDKGYTLKKGRGVVTVNYSGRGGVRLINANNQYTNDYVKNGTKWKVSGANKNGLLIGNGTYLPWSYAKIVINYKTGYGVNAFDKNFQQIGGTNAKFKADTGWKIFDLRADNKYYYYMVSKTEYIRGDFTK